MKKTITLKTINLTNGQLEVTARSIAAARESLKATIAAYCGERDPDATWVEAEIYRNGIKDNTITVLISMTEIYQ